LKNGIQYFKYSTYIVIAILAFIYARSCNCGREYTKPTQDTISVKTVVIHDTIKQDTHYIPVVRKVIVPLISHDTLYRPSLPPEPINNDQVVLDYYTKRYYKDTVKNKYGDIVIEDTVTENKLVGHGVKTNLDIPTVVKTYTIEARQRTVLLFGVGMIGNKVSPLFGTEATLDLKTKSDKIYEVGAILLRGGDLYYKISTKIPIRLRKK